MLKASPSPTLFEANDRVDTLPATPALYERYRALVLRTAYLLLGDWAEAEDVAQEVWLAVDRHRAAYRPELGAWTTWLHRITVNRALNVRRRLRRWVATPAATDEPVDDGPLPLDAVLRDERGRTLWAAVQSLPAKQRAAIVLRYYHDLSYEEIATVLDCPIGTVRSRLHTAHARLRETLKERP